MAMAHRIEVSAPLFGAQVEPFIESFAREFRAWTDIEHADGPVSSMLRKLARDLMAQTP